jgi:phosphoglycerate dehydrogenase-like enzyme
MSARVVCVFHPRMATLIATGLRRAFPDIDVRVETDVTRDPQAAMDADVLIANRFPPGLLGRMARLRWVQLTGVGTDHVVAGEPRSDLLVTHAGSVPARAVAEFAMMALLALTKDAPTLIRQQRDHVWRLPDARRLYGTRLVVIGTGAIGSEVASRARGFDVEVIGVNRSGVAPAGWVRVVPANQRAEVLTTADNVVVAVPLDETTRGLVGTAELAVLPRHAAVINVSRAEVVDAVAVVDALKAGRLRGAVVDVHEQEPVPPESPRWDVPGLWLTPHCAYVYPEEPADLVALCVENLRRFIDGEPLHNPMRRT